MGNKIPKIQTSSLMSWVVQKGKVVVFMTKNQIALDVLKKHVGDEMFQELMESLSGATIYFAPNMEERNEKIVEDFRKGLPVSKLMEKYQLSRSRLYDILPLIEK